MNLHVPESLAGLGLSVYDGMLVGEELNWVAPVSARRSARMGSAPAAWTVGFAKTDPAKGHKGIAAFIVPMDKPGVELEKHLDKMGQRATDTSAFAMTDAVIPACNRIGEEGQGFKIAMQTLDFARPGTAAGAVGVAQAAFDVPIAMHQGVNFMTADTATEIARRACSSGRLRA